MRLLGDILDQTITTDKTTSEGERQEYGQVVVKSGTSPGKLSLISERSH